MNRFNFKSKKGFTLIELLVVIGILAVLAAIMIPIISGAINKANMSADKTNANEMTNSIERFASEYELYKQDIASGKLKDIANLDGAQGRVYNVTVATTRGDLEKLESEEGLNGRAIDKDTNYPTNVDTARAVVQTYEKTSSSTFEPKQSDAHYYYSPDCGVVVAQDTAKADVLTLNSLVSSGVDASGQPLTQDTVWIDLTDGTDSTYPPCKIAGHQLNDGMEHGIPANCDAGHQYTCQCTKTWTIPDGGEYYVGVTSTTVGSYGDAPKYSAGETLPCGSKPTTGDVFVYGDYEYRYNCYNDNSPRGWTKDESQNGWGARVLDSSKSSYGEILSEIAYLPVNTLYGTFRYCTSLTQTPEFPESITNMSYAFQNCSALTTVSTLPNKVTNLQATFNNCTSLAVGPEIPETVTNMRSTFASCRKLTVAPAIPSNVIDMTYTFNVCKSLTTPPDMSNAKSVQLLYETFRQTAITKGPKIPPSVTDMSYAFQSCASLTTAPDMSEATGVTNMSYAFNSCTALTSPPNMSNVTNVTNMSHTFYYCSKLRRAPDLSNATKLIDMTFTFRDCTALTSAPTIPIGVQNMDQTFYNCKSLTTPPNMSNAIGVINMNKTFSNCIVLKTAPDLSNSVNLSIMTDTFVGCTKLTTAPNLSNAINLTNMSNTFSGCTSLTAAPDISNSNKLTTISSAFNNCSALVTPPPVIPSSVTIMSSTFNNCILLTGTIEINANPTSYFSCFANTRKSIKLTGSSSVLSSIAATANRGNATVVQ